MTKTSRKRWYGMNKLSIDEVIAHCHRRVERLEKFSPREKCETWSIDSEYGKEYWEHRQVAEWLEELKELREKNDTLKALYDDARKEGNNLINKARNRAIDDAMEAAAKAICIGCGYLKGCKCSYKGSNCGVSKPMLEVVMKALEKLKGGE